MALTKLLLCKIKNKIKFRGILFRRIQLKFKYIKKKKTLKEKTAAEERI